MRMQRKNQEKKITTKIQKIKILMKFAGKIVRKFRWEYLPNRQLKGKMARKIIDELKGEKKLLETERKNPI